MQQACSNAHWLTLWQTSNPSRKKMEYSLFHPAMQGSAKMEHLPIVLCRLHLLLIYEQDICNNWQQLMRYCLKTGTTQKHIEIHIRAKESLLGSYRKQSFIIWLACNAGVFWRVIECILTKWVPSWIQTWKRLGERRDGVQGSGC